MGVLQNTLIGMAVVTGMMLLGAFGGWYYLLETYRDQMSRRARMVLKFGAPPFMVIAASPILDVVILLNGGGFPTIGFPGVALGLVGSGGIYGYVLFEVRENVGGGEAAPDPQDD